MTYFSILERVYFITFPLKMPLKYSKSAKQEKFSSRPYSKINSNFCLGLMRWLGSCQKIVISMTSTKDYRVSRELHEYGVTCIWKMSLSTPQSIYWSCPILAANGRLSSKLSLLQLERHWGQLPRSIWVTQCNQWFNILYFTIVKVTNEKEL